MKFSIVTISFNQREFLKECIDSVLSQEGVDFEYIVVDPGSTDGSRELIDSYGDQILKVYEKDRGPADGLNKGFSLASGDIFCFLNSDDVFLPGALRRAHDVLSVVAADAVNFGGYIIDEHGVRTKRVIPSFLRKMFLLYGEVNLFQQGVFFRRALFEESGPFNTDNRVNWDGELFLDFCLSGAKFYAVKAPVALFRIYGSSITGGQGYVDRLASQHRLKFEAVTGQKLESFKNKVVKKVLWYCKNFTVLYTILFRG